MMIVAGLIVLCSRGLASLVKSSTVMVSDAGGLLVETTAVPGDPSHFDPIAAYDTVHQFARANLELGYLVIDYVRADSTLDLDATYDPTVQYRFFRELSASPPKAPPLGGQGVTDQPWDDMSEILIQPTRMLSSRGNVQGTMRLPTPTCSMRTLWNATRLAHPFEYLDVHRIQADFFHAFLNGCLL